MIFGFGHFHLVNRSLKFNLESTNGLCSNSFFWTGEITSKHLYMQIVNCEVVSQFEVGH